MEKAIFLLEEKKYKISTNDIKFISQFNNWNIDYTYEILYEYEKFLELKNKNESLLPSPPIDILWQTHILNTKSYYNYCINKFGKIIHHNLSESLNYQNLKLKLKITLNEYIKEFGYPKYIQIWINFENKFLDCFILQTQTQTHTQLQLPDYNQHKTFEIDHIKIFIFYTFNDGYFLPEELCKIACKKWRPNNYPLDRQIISVKISKNTKIDNLKKIIFDKSQHNNIAIKIYPHPSWKKKNNYDKIILNPSDTDFKFYIGELEEI